MDDKIGFVLGVLTGILLAIIGLGVVGCTSATCAYESGHVACIDWRD